MKPIFSFLCVILLSCSHHQTKHETETATADSIVSKIIDSLSPSITKDREFKGEPEFLSRNFEDTVIIKEIQQLVKNIDSYKLNDSVELKNEDFLEDMTDGGGSLTGYLLNKKLLKIREWVGLSWGVLEVNFYFDNEQLIFVRETEDHFQIDSNGVNHSKIGLRFQGEYYFNKNKLVDEVSLGHNRFEDDTNDPVKEYLQRAKQNRELLLKRKK